MLLPKSFCCKKSWCLLTGSKIISISYLVFTAAMIGGLTFIMMNERTFHLLSKMQLSDYLLVGKSLFPQAAYIEPSSFEPNNLAYSSATAKNNASSRNITKASISLKQQEINHQKNKREIKSYTNEEEFGASINGSNYSTVSPTSEKDNNTTYSTNVSNGNNPFVTSQPNINYKSTLNDNQTNIIDMNHHSSSDHIQTSSALSTKSITTDVISENSTILTKVTITTYSTDVLVGNNSFVTSRPIIDDKSSSNENQTTVSIYSTVQNLSDGFQTSSYVSTNKDESKSSINVTAKVTTIDSTNISIENSSMTITPSQNVAAKEHVTRMSSYSSSVPIEEDIRAFNSRLGLIPMIKANGVRGKSKDGKSTKSPRKVTLTINNLQEHAVEDILISVIVLHGIYFGACLLLMIGISKRSAGFVAVWVLAEFFRQLAVLAIWVLLCFYTCIMLNKDADDAKYAIPICAAILIVIVLTFYFWLVICSFYKELRKQHTVIPEGKNDNAMIDT